MGQIASEMEEIMRTEMMNGRKYFVYDHGRDEVPDMTALKMMERNNIEGLLPFQSISRGEESYFRYEAGEDETLTQWLTRAQYRRDVVGALESLIYLEKETEAYLLKPDHICTDPSFIVISGHNCKAAYIPTVEGAQGKLLELVQKIISSVRYALDEDFSYLFDLQNAFGRKDIRNMDDLKKWLRIINGEEKTDMDGIVNEEADREEDLKEETVDKVRPAERPADSLEGIFGDLGLGGKEKKEKKEKSGKAPKTDRHFDFLSKGKQKEKQREDMVSNIMQEKPAPVSKAASQGEIINDLERGDMTVMMDAGQTPVLLHMGSNREYALLNSSCTIGSGAQTDITIANNKTVSRNHARIFQNGDFWYIEDLGSMNGTCVNGERLRKMEPYKLETGARIQLSNENYVFQLN